VALEAGEFDRALDALVDQPGADLSANPPALCLVRLERFGVVIAGLGLRSRYDAAVRILVELGADPATAEDLCSSPVVPALKGVSRERAEAAHARFVAAGISARVTEKGWRQRR
jgi:hypothetical protein